jgi:hypothetical protein
MAVNGTLANHGTVRLESVDSSWSTGLSASLVNEADGVLEANTGTGGGRSFTGSLVNRGVVRTGGGQRLTLTGSGSVLTQDGGRAEGDGLVVIGAAARVVFTGASPSGPSLVALGNGTASGEVPAGETLWVRGDSVNGHVTANAAELVNHGTLRVESADSSWSSSLSGTLANAEGGLVLVRPGTGGGRAFSGALVNAGVVRVDGGARLSVSGPGTLLTQDGGRVEGDGLLVVGSGAGVTFTGRPPAGPSRVVLGSATAGGVVSAQETLWVRGDSVTGHASATAEDLVNHGTLRLESGDSSWEATLRGTITNAAEGLLDVGLGTGGARTLAGTITNGGRVEVAGGVQLGMAGTVTNAGVIHVAAGSVIAAEGSTTTFVQDGGAVFGEGRTRVGGGATLVLTGAAPSRPSALGLGNATIRGTVPEGETLWVRGDGFSGHVLATASGLVNRGTIRLESADAGWESSLRGALTIAAGGLLDVAAGSGGSRGFQGSLSNEGAIHVGTGATLRVSGSGTSLAIDGGRVEGGGLLVVGGQARVDFTPRPPSGPSLVALGNATAGGTLHAGQTLWIRGDGYWGHVLATADDLVSHGTLRLESADAGWESSLRGGVTIAPEGRLEVEPGSGGGRGFQGTLTHRGVIRVGAGAVLRVSGSASTLTLDGGRVEGGGVLVVGGQARADFTPMPLSGPSRVALANATVRGTLQPQQTLWVRGDAYWGHVLATAEDLVNHGTLRLESADAGWESSLRGVVTNAPDGVIEVQPGSGGSRAFQGSLTNEGTVVLNAALTASGSGFVNAEGGSMGGAFGLTLSGVTLANAGRLRPGSPLGTLPIAGSVAFAGTGSLDVELGGPAAGQFDRLQLSGSAALDGTLRVALANAFVPEPGQTFEVLTFGSRSGAFSSVELPTLGNGTRLEASLGTGKLLLTVVPE